MGNTVYFPCVEFCGSRKWGKITEKRCAGYEASTCIMPLDVSERCLYASPNFVLVIKSRRMRWAGNVARMVERRGVYRVLVGKPEGKRPLGRRRRKWKDNINL